MMFGNTMYLRPGNLWKNFNVLRMHSDNVDGYLKNSYKDTGIIVDGILAQATSNERELTKHLWDQDQHSLTHTLVVSGKCTLNKSDILAYQEKAYLVLAVDNAGDLGIAGIAYLEERNDLK